MNKFKEFHFVKTFPNISCAELSINDFTWFYFVSQWLFYYYSEYDVIDCQQKKMHLNQLKCK